MRKVLIALLMVPLAACAGVNGKTTANTPASTQTAAQKAPKVIPLTADQKTEAVAKINDVTGMLIDSNKLYGDAAKLAKDGDFKVELAKLSDERGSQATNFQARVRNLGGTPVTSGGVGGPWQESLMHLAALGQNDTKAAVGQVLIAENGLVDKLNDTLGDAKLADSTKAFLRSARDNIVADRDRVAVLKSKIDAQTASAASTPTKPTKVKKASQ